MVDESWVVDKSWLSTGNFCHVCDAKPTEPDTMSGSLDVQNLCMVAACI